MQRYTVNISVSLFADDLADAQMLGRLLRDRVEGVTGGGQSIVRLAGVSEGRFGYATSSPTPECDGMPCCPCAPCVEDANQAQEAEIRAENAWLHAAEYDPRMEDPREW